MIQFIVFFNKKREPVFNISTRWQREDTYAGKSGVSRGKADSRPFTMDGNIMGKDNP